MDIQKLIKDAERADAVASLMDGVNPHHVLELAARLAEAEAQLVSVAESGEQWEANAHEFSRCADRLEAQLARYSMSPGHADQRKAESAAVRVALGFGADADDVAPCDLVDAINFLRAAPPAPVKLPKKSEINGRGSICDSFAEHRNAVIDQCAEAIKAAGVEVADE